MRPSGLTNPRKFWGKINRDLKKGDYISIVIKINYNMSSYEGKKLFLVIQLFLEEKKFFGISYIVVGCLNILWEIFFPIGNKFQQEKKEL